MEIRLRCQLPVVRARKPSTSSPCESRRPRSNWALAATMMVETLITSAPMLIGRMKPIGANTPAATGMASAL